MLQVEKVIFELSEGIFDACSVSVLHLGPAGHSRPHRMALVIVRNLFSQLLDKARTLGPGADETHFPPNHVKKLGKFVKPILSNEPSNARDPRVVCFGPLGPTVAFRVQLHRAKLEEVKCFTRETNAGLAVKDRPLRIQPNSDSGQSYYWRKQTQCLEDQMPGR